MSRSVESLRRIVQYLPSANLLTQKPTVDDPFVEILKGHLIVEAALTDICNHLLKTPSALARGQISFAVRLDIVLALLDEDELPSRLVAAIRCLNRIRNSLAHRLEVDYETELQQFFEHCSSFDDVVNAGDSLARRVTGCIAFICGALESRLEGTSLRITQEVP